MGRISKEGVFIAIIVFVLSVGNFIWGYHRGYDASTEDMKQRLAEVELTKSVKPQPTREKKVGVDTVPVVERSSRLDRQDRCNRLDRQSVSDKRDGQDREDYDRKIIIDKGCDSSLVAYVPIRQKVYKDSSYTAYVSGYNANLDSLIIRSKVITQTRTKYRRWNLGIIGGYGYGFQSKKLEPFVGLGITWNVFR